MRDEWNIWSVSFQIANKNYASLIIYCIYIVFLALLDEYFQSNFGKLNSVDICIGDFGYSSAFVGSIPYEAVRHDCRIA